MAWNGTVTCGVCYKTGHNRRGCPTLKSRHEQALATKEEDRTYYDQRLIREFENKERSNKSRKCTYCGEKGHNRRSCTILKVHMGHVKKQEVAFRTAFVEHLNELGLNVGSLVQGVGTSISGEYRTAVVTDILWDNISIVKAYIMMPRFLKVQPLKAFSDPRVTTYFNITSPDSWPTGPKWSSAANSNRWEEDYYKCEVLGSTGTDAKAPHGWIDDMTHVKEFFKDRESYQWPDDQQDDCGGSYYSCEWWDLENEKSS